MTPLEALFRWVGSLPTAEVHPAHLDCGCGNCPEPARAADGEARKPIRTKEMENRTCRPEEDQ